MATLDEVVRYADDELRTTEVPDYPGAVNGLQLANRGEVTRIAAAVDFSLQTVAGAVRDGATLLLVHHGMFWGGARPLVGVHFERLRTAMDAGLAVYSSHLPLDLHPDLGNNALLARALGLTPDSPFGRYESVFVGVSGTSEVPTAQLLTRAKEHARRFGGDAIMTPMPPDRVTRRWAIITGAGASSASLAEARERGVDTLIVGEGPHHSGVEALEHGIAVIYAGHYATETLGVQALAEKVGSRFGLPWSFVDVPTGL